MAHTSTSTIARGISSRRGGLGCSASTAKWCIHPNQIEWANQAFTPSQELYEKSERLLAAYAEVTAAGRGAAVHDGKMIDEATRKLAEKLAATGRASGLEPPG